MMSTLTENIAIIDYFEKRSDLIRKKHVNLAFLQCPPFQAEGVRGSVRLDIKKSQPSGNESFIGQAWHFLLIAITQNYHAGL